MNVFLREYPLSDKQKQGIADRMKNLTGVDNLAEHDFRALVLENDKGLQFTSIVFNSKYSDIESLSRIYNLIFKCENEMFIRTRSYLKMRKRYHLETDETIVTVCSYLQCSGLVNEIDLFNKALVCIENCFEY